MNVVFKHQIRTVFIYW